jgi:hypothetical protein
LKSTENEYLEKVLFTIKMEDSVRLKHEYKESEDGTLELKLLKKRTKNACFHCKYAKTACETERPCRRCIRTNREETCIDSISEKRGRKRRKGVDTYVYNRNILPYNSPSPEIPKTSLMVLRKRKLNFNLEDYDFFEDPIKKEKETSPQVKQEFQEDKISELFEELAVQCIKKGKTRDQFTILSKAIKLIEIQRIALESQEKELMKLEKKLEDWQKECDENIEIIKEQALEIRKLKIKAGDKGSISEQAMNFMLPAG